LAVDRAREGLASCLRSEDEAAKAAAEADAAIERERQSASDLLAEDHVVEAFAAWLKVGRKAADDAWRRQADAEARTARARAELTAARAAAEAAEQVLGQREAERRAEDERRAQLALEEAARHGREEQET
jgi:uncharacterized damage-inducible protein DinB